MTDTPLKLAALDVDDLGVISAHLQDAVTVLADVVWQPSQARLVAVFNRFDWSHGLGRRHGPWRRRRCGLTIERARSAQRLGLEPGEGGRVLSLLAITFEPGEAPGGTILLQFSGGAALRLAVECIEARLDDLGPSWDTSRRPGHDDAAKP